MVEGGEAGFAVGDGRPLAFAFAVVAGDADEGVIGEAGGEGVVLDGDHLLEPDEIRAEGVDGIEEKLGALRPGIGAVSFVGVADIERHHAKRFGAERGGQKQEWQQGAQQRFHGVKV